LDSTTFVVTCPTDMLKSALYLRVSSEEQAKQYSLSSQKKELAALAKKRGYNVVQVYNEGGISGESINTRPQLLQLLVDAHNGVFQYLLLISLDRLSRSLEDSLYLRSKLQKAGVTLLTPSQEFSCNSIEHDFTANIWSSIADFERKLIAQRCQQGRIEKRSKGGWLGGHAPRGYRYNPVTKSLEIYPEEADLIKQIINTSLNLSPYKLSLDLRGKGITITPRQIRRITENNKILFYSGRVRDFAGNIIEAEWDPIITVQFADEILTAKRKRRTISADSTRAKFLLTGLGIFRCRFCGRTVKSFKSKKYKTKPQVTYYRCSSIQYGETCPNLKMRHQKKIDQIVWDTFTEVLNGLKDTKVMIQEWVNSQQDLRRVDTLKKELNKIEKRQERLILAIETDTIALKDVSERLSVLHCQSKVIQDQINDEVEKSRKIDIDTIYSLADSFDPAIDLERSEKRELIKLLSNKIELSKKAIYINFIAAFRIGNSKNNLSTEFRIPIQ